ncbi:glycerophosphoryl diester phosphodiesterase [Brevundimonas nasdae]|uniref:glycerophosphodiester phosphodiesterase n=1 Tax=Brevundimonas nasdae TaxID=172043 RepID=UPI0019136D48|nr:glycerophosphodiester phosphodiesterase [Brevundimonas nasdae]MBK6024038.1 glycerophosphodiester phosphodiesterase [Brevundimonas nasdae]MDQ0450693.1 glycerophosphoryl diester phosphodiesterase [Brevundimonas nasdae]
MIRAILTALILFTGAPAVAQPLIIAHRGASGERPEHTRSAYELAIEQGADVIEPDLVMSKDGVFIDRHENEIGGTTDVASRPEFADRKTTKTIDGVVTVGWFTEDFTLAELKTLRARERLPQVRTSNVAYDERDPILTFDEVVTIAREASARTGRTIAVAPELKHPTYFAGIGLPMEDAFVAELERLDLTGADAPIIIQCFEVGPLERLSRRITAPLAQLVGVGGAPEDRPDLTYARMITPEGLKAVARYAAWVAPDVTLVMPRDAQGRSTAPSTLVADAHAAGLKIVVWTVRAENIFLPLEHRSNALPAVHGDMAGYVRDLADTGVDAIFSDFPGLAREGLR